MPMITVEGPKIQDIALKRQMVKKVYDAAYEVYKAEHIVVVIQENPPENVAVNGQLIADRLGQ